ncbi:hypothetical protein V5799_017712 [Amblyomma americanum]|uniref:Uncharacterized protein n=1 Tax=Amblyomma americanum TaxID=6943 RepID=A0AAQ4F1H9_AMBAM
MSMWLKASRQSDVTIADSSDSSPGSSSSSSLIRGHFPGIADAIFLDIGSLLQATVAMPACCCVPFCSRRGERDAHGKKVSCLDFPTNPGFKKMDCRNKERRGQGVPHKQAHKSGLKALCRW